MKKNIIVTMVLTALCLVSSNAYAENVKTRFGTVNVAFDDDNFLTNIYLSKSNIEQMSGQYASKDAHFNIMAMI